MSCVVDTILRRRIGISQAYRIIRADHRHEGLQCTPDNIGGGCAVEAGTRDLSSCYLVERALAQHVTSERQSGKL